MIKFLTLWEFNCTCLEEGRDLEDLHLLSGTKQNYCQEQVSNPIDWWPSGPTQGGQVSQWDQFEVWLSLGSNRSHICMEDYLQIQGNPFWMVGYALRVHNYPCYFYESNGWHLMALHQLSRGFFCGWHPHRQQELGITLATNSVIPSNPVATQIVCQLGEIHLWHEPGTIFGLNHRWVRFACGLG